jgi:hypothetical protein
VPGGTNPAAVLLLQLAESVVTASCSQPGAWSVHLSVTGIQVGHSGSQYAAPLASDVHSRACVAVVILFLHVCLLSLEHALVLLCRYASAAFILRR